MLGILEGPKPRRRAPFSSDAAKYLYSLRPFPVSAPSLPFAPAARNLLHLLLSIAKPGLKVWTFASIPATRAFQMTSFFQMAGFYSHFFALAFTGLLTTAFPSASSASAALSAPGFRASAVRALILP